jgi:hypothetical protein
MNQKSIKNRTNRNQPLKPILQALTMKAPTRKWYECIYYSSHDMIGQLLILLNEMAGEYTGKFLKHQVYILKSTNKSGVDIKVNKMLQTLIKSN